MDDSQNQALAIRAQELLDAWERKDGSAQPDDFRDFARSVPDGHELYALSQQVIATLTEIQRGEDLGILRDLLEKMARRGELDIEGGPSSGYSPQYSFR